MIFKKNTILIKKKKISYILKYKNKLKKSVVFLPGYKSDKEGTPKSELGRRLIENGLGLSYV